MEEYKNFTKPLTAYTIFGYVLPGFFFISLLVFDFSFSNVKDDLKPDILANHQIALDISTHLLNLFKPQNRMFYRLFHQGAKQLALDNAGRLLIPIAHMERVGLVSEVMLIAYNDRIEIWDKSKYFNMIEGNMADFADLADEVMGDLDNGE
jgi:hypothetical protein